jgi:hypothetical protein
VQGRCLLFDTLNLEHVDHFYVLAGLIRESGGPSISGDVVDSQDPTPGSATNIIDQSVIAKSW